MLKQMIWILMPNLYLVITLLLQEINPSLMPWQKRGQKCFKLNLRNGNIKCRWVRYKLVNYKSNHWRICLYLNLLVKYRKIDAIDLLLSGSASLMNAFIWSRTQANNSAFCLLVPVQELGRSVSSQRARQIQKFKSAGEGSIQPASQEEEANALHDLIIYVVSFCNDFGLFVVYVFVVAFLFLFPSICPPRCQPF